MTLLERETSAQIGGGILRSDHCLQLGSIASLAPETTGGEILVAFWPKHGLTSDLRVPYFFWGSMPPDPLAYSCSSKRTQWPYQSKIASSGPVQRSELLWSRSVTHTLFYFRLPCHCRVPQPIVNVLISKFFYRTYKLTDWETNGLSDGQNWLLNPRRACGCGVTTHSNIPLGLADWYSVYFPVFLVWMYTKEPVYNR